jgi:hypothetical protein
MINSAMMSCMYWVPITQEGSAPVIGPLYRQKCKAHIASPSDGSRGCVGTTIGRWGVGVTLIDGAMMYALSL